MQLRPTKEHAFWNRVRNMAQPLICNVTLRNIVKILLLQFLYLQNNGDNIFWGGLYSENLITL